MKGRSVKVIRSQSQSIMHVSKAHCQFETNLYSAEEDFLNAILYFSKALYFCCRTCKEDPAITMASPSSLHNARHRGERTENHGWIEANRTYTAVLDQSKTTQERHGACYRVGELWTYIPFKPASLALKC